MRGGDKIIILERCKIQKNVYFLGGMSTVRYGKLITYIT